MNNKKNPFAEQPISSDGTYFSLSDMYPKAYNKHETTPFTKIRIILANGAEFEAQWFCIISRAIAPTTTFAAKSPKSERANSNSKNAFPA